MAETKQALVTGGAGFIGSHVVERLIQDGHSVTVLEGITRDSLVTVAHDLGYEVIEMPISRDQLYVADEVFVCGTAAEVIGLREIDFRTIGSGESGPITRHLQQTFHKVVRGQEPRYVEWLDPVNAPVTSNAAVPAE